MQLSMSQSFRSSSVRELLRPKLCNALSFLAVHKTLQLLAFTWLEPSFQKRWLFHDYTAPGVSHPTARDGSFMILQRVSCLHLSYMRSRIEVERHSFDLLLRDV